jgi:hypothetical protein
VLVANSEIVVMGIEEKEGQKGSKEKKLRGENLFLVDICMDKAFVDTIFIQVRLGG